MDPKYLQGKIVFELFVFLGHPNDTAPGLGHITSLLATTGWGPRYGYQLAAKNIFLYLLQLYYLFRVFDLIGYWYGEEEFLKWQETPKTEIYNKMSKSSNSLEKKN